MSSNSDNTVKTTVLVSQPSAKPNRKVSYAAIAAAVLGLGAAIATGISTGEFDTTAIQNGVGTLMAALVPVITAYMTKEAA